MLKNNNKSLFSDVETGRSSQERTFSHRNNSDDIKITSAPSLFGIFPEVSSVTMPASLPPRLEKSARKEPPLRLRNFKERALSR